MRFMQIGHKDHKAQNLFFIPNFTSVVSNVVKKTQKVTENGHFQITYTACKLYSFVIIGYLFPYKAILCCNHLNQNDIGNWLEPHNFCMFYLSKQTEAHDKIAQHKSDWRYHKLFKEILAWATWGSHDQLFAKCKICVQKSGKNVRFDESMGGLWGQRLNTAYPFVVKGVRGWKGSLGQYYKKSTQEPCIFFTSGL